MPIPWYPSRVLKLIIIVGLNIIYSPEPLLEIQSIAAHTFEYTPGLPSFPHDSPHAERPYTVKTFPSRHTTGPPESPENHESVKVIQKFIVLPEHESVPLSAKLSLSGPSGTPATNSSFQTMLL